MECFIALPYDREGVRRSQTTEAATAAFILFESWLLRKIYAEHLSKSATHLLRMAVESLWMLIFVVKEALSIFLFQQRDMALALRAWAGTGLCDGRRTSLRGHRRRDPVSRSSKTRRHPWDFPLRYFSCRVGVGGSTLRKYSQLCKGGTPRRGEWCW